jgi:hypothetical protein
MAIRLSRLAAATSSVRKRRSQIQAAPAIRPTRWCCRELWGKARTLTGPEGLVLAVLEDLDRAAPVESAATSASARRATTLRLPAREVRQRAQDLAEDRAAVVPVAEDLAAGVEVEEVVSEEGEADAEAAEDLVAVEEGGAG